VKKPDLNVLRASSESQGRQFASAQLPSICRGGSKHRARKGSCLKSPPEVSRLKIMAGASLWPMLARGGSADLSIKAADVHRVKRDGAEVRPVRDKKLAEEAIPGAFSASKRARCRRGFRANRSLSFFQRVWLAVFSRMPGETGRWACSDRAKASGRNRNASNSKKSHDLLHR
jgi:hypothetical protein